MIFTAESSVSIGTFNLEESCLYFFPSSSLNPWVNISSTSVPLRLRGSSWRSRHSWRFLAPTPDGSKPCIKWSASSACSGATPELSGISSRVEVWRYPSSLRLLIMISAVLPSDSGMAERRNCHRRCSYKSALTLLRSKGDIVSSVDSPKYPKSLPSLSLSSK